MRGPAVPSTPGHRRIRTRTRRREIAVRIDGLVYVQAEGLFNRHWSNQAIESVGVFNQSQGVSDGPFEVWYDNFEITLEAWGDRG